jgi:HAMP domain-containing protein
MMLLLFGGFGLANSLFYYTIMRSEMEWSSSEQARGRALLLAAFMGRDRLPSSPDFDTFLLPALRRLSASTEGGLNVQWFEQDKNGTKATPLLNSAELPPPAMLGPEQWAQLRKEDADSLFVIVPERDADLNFGYARVLDKTGAVRAVVAISSRDGIVLAESKAVLFQCLWYVLAVSLIGLCVAEILTRSALRAIVQLEKDANALARGDYNHEWRNSRISEFNDLSNTLQTIAQILQEGIRQTRRRFFQAELLPRKEEIAMDCQEFCDSNMVPSPSEPRVALRRVNGGCLEDFWGFRSDEKGWRLVVGRLEPSSAELDMLGRIVRANSSRDFLLGCAFADKPEEVWGRMRRVFPCIQGELVLLPQGSDAVSHLVYPPLPDEGKASDKRGVLGTLDEESLRFAREYARRFPDQPVEAVAEKLSMLLASGGSGLLVVYDITSKQR